MGIYNINTQEEMVSLGKQVAQSLAGGEVLAFTGGLGSGKTTFCTGLAQGLGCTDPVSSPTYTIVNYYRGRLPLAHFDAYRVQSAADLETAGFFDYLDQGAVVAVEWSENIPHSLPRDAITIDIKTAQDGARTVTIEGADGF